MSIKELLPISFVFVLAYVLVFVPGSSPVAVESSREENGEVVTAKLLADQFREFLDSAEHLVVTSHQRVSYLHLPLPAGTEVEKVERDPSKAFAEAMKLWPGPTMKMVVVNVTVRSEMFPDRFEATFSRDDVSEIVTHLKLSPSESGGLPTLYERHYYPALGVSRENSFLATDSWGVEEPSLPNPLLSEIPGACNTAEFWYTWLGGSSEAELIASIVSEGYVVGEEVFNGEDAYRIHREVYRDEEETGFFSSLHIFWFSKASRLLIGWRPEQVAIKHGEQRSAGYKVGDLTYHYDFSSPE